MKSVTVTMPDWMWGRLASIGHRRGMTIPELLGVELRLILDWPSTINDRLPFLMSEIESARRPK